jgi:cardiolipin synthase
LLVPCLITLCRVPLALLFAASLATPPLALAILATTAATDVLDGQLARRFGLETETDALLDPIVDKSFAAVAISALVADGLLPLGHAWRLCTREVCELLLVGFWLPRRGREAWRREPPRPNVLGKASTALQFSAIVAALDAHAALAWLLWATAIGGMLAAIGYGATTLAAYRARSNTAWRGA